MTSGKILMIIFNDNTHNLFLFLKRNKITNGEWHSRFEINILIYSLSYLLLSCRAKGSLSIKLIVRLINKLLVYMHF